MRVSKTLRCVSGSVSNSLRPCEMKDVLSTANLDHLDCILLYAYVISQVCRTRSAQKTYPGGWGISAEFEPRSVFHGDVTAELLEDQSGIWNLQALHRAV